MPNCFSVRKLRVFLSSPIFKCSALAIAGMLTMAGGCPDTFTGSTVVNSSLVKFQALHSLGPTQSQAPVLQTADGYLYGTTLSGGSYGFGSVYRAGTAGGYKVIYSFTGGMDGAVPQAGLIQGVDGFLYGTTVSGGNGWGTIFKMTTNGALSSLYAFTNGIDGANPYAALVQANDGRLYGVAYQGGSGNFGTVFGLSTNGAFTALYSFTNGVDGEFPYGALMQARDGYLYGTTAGKEPSYGTLFRISTGGSFTPLWKFADGTDGAAPYGALVQATNGTLYGTTYGGGVTNDGVIFSLTTNDTFTSIYIFGTNGYNPCGGLTLGSNGDFYGTASNGGTNNNGVVFEMDTNGGYTQLYLFGGTNDGGNPKSAVVIGRDGNLYGATYVGDTNGSGGIYCLQAGGGFSSIHAFDGDVDGANFATALAKGRDGNLYGTTYGSQVGTFGSVYRMTPAGMWTNLNAFSTNDGGPVEPQAALVVAGDGHLYGTSVKGGSEGFGAVYRVATNGTVTTIYSFTNGVDGSAPHASLLPAQDGFLYGAATAGGNVGDGDIFRISTSGVFSPVYSFNGVSDGSTPVGGLTQTTDGYLYGTTASGGASNFGTIFRTTTNGALTPLYSFTGAADGSSPECTLLQGNDGFLYGTATDGTNSYGSVFRTDTNGNVFVLHTFTDGSDGGQPSGAIIQATDGNFYGTASSGGINGNGTIYVISSGQVFTPVYSFSSGLDGGDPVSGLVQVGNYLYGATDLGGVEGVGVAYRISLAFLPTSLVIQQEGSNVVLTWNDPAYTLQSAPSLTGPFKDVSSASSPYTVPANQPQQYFRLVAY